MVTSGRLPPRHRSRLNIAPDRGLADLEFGGADHATVTQCAEFGENLQRVALWPRFAADRLPGILGEHLPLGAENPVHGEAAVGCGDADCARDSAGGGLDGNDFPQWHAEGWARATAGVEEDAFTGQHKQA